jgi:DNA-binding SARP family transcriptional activator
VDRSLVECSGDRLTLAARAAVDLRLLIDLARTVADRIAMEVSAPDDLLAARDLLPDWSEPWIESERERFRQLRAQALEAMVTQLAGARRFGRAVEVGLAAVEGEPLRESAHRELIKAHLAQGNRGEAIRQFVRYRALLRDELGLEPSADLTALVGLERSRRQPGVGASRELTRAG